MAGEGEVVRVAKVGEEMAVDWATLVVVEREAAEVVAA